MTSLIAYRRVVDTVTTHSLKLPDASQGAQAGQELCTLADGRTVVSLFDNFTLPTDQPAAIAASIETLMPTAAELAEIKAVSPIVQLIDERMNQKIRAQYTLNDELKFARIGLGALMGPSVYTFEPGEQDALLAFGAFVQGVRQWGRDQRAALGL